MNNVELFEVLGELDDDLLESPGATGEVSKTARHGFVRRAAVAACLCLAVAGIFFYKSEAPQKTLPEKLEGYGLSAETVDDPIFASSGQDRPEMTKDDLLEILKAGPVVRGQIQNSVYVEVTSGNEHWYIARFTLKVSEVISGELGATTVELVSASVYICDDNEIPGQFLIEDSFSECRDGAEGVFVLREIDEDTVWEIGGVKVAARALGDHMLKMRLDAGNGQYTYDGITVTDSEISDGATIKAGS